MVCEKFIFAFFFFRAMMVEEWEIFREFPYPRNTGHYSLLVYNFYKLISQQAFWQGQHPQFINFVSKSVKQVCILAPMVRYQIHKYMKEWHQFRRSFLVEKNIFFELTNLFANSHKKFSFVLFLSFTQNFVLLKNKLVVKSMLDWLQVGVVEVEVEHWGVWKVKSAWDLIKAPFNINMFIILRLWDFFQRLNFHHAWDFFGVMV